MFAMKVKKDEKVDSHRKATTDISTHETRVTKQSYEGKHTSRIQPWVGGARGGE